MSHRAASLLAVAAVAVAVAFAVNVIPMSEDLALAVAGIALVAAVLASLELDYRRQHGASGPWPRRAPSGA